MRTWTSSSSQNFKNIFNSDSENIFENSLLLTNSSFNGKFDPYFSSTTNAYEDLIKILNHPNFNIKDVSTNIRNFKETCQNQLSLLTIKKYTIPISDMKMQSTSQPTRKAYPILLIDILTKIMSNPSLISKIYNGSGIEKENKGNYNSWVF
ncbi:hypothetical protein C1646_774405 [Rhizophagus diaphanus]|nr:hypothetical protein C1646_774405 [Rhizophagus diaphanus] [Rhizophagus sp. MUCL 43196]